jgi:hypothetical protein
MKRLVILFALALLVSCGKDFLEVDALGENTGIIGTWIDNGYKGDTLMMYRAGKLDSQKYGFTIKVDGTFIEHKNAGWCGTPPISYDNFEGTWEIVSDSLLDITVAYWGGMMTYQIRIIGVDEKELAIRYLYDANRMDATGPDI